MPSCGGGRALAMPCCGGGRRSRVGSAGASPSHVHAGHAALFLFSESRITHHASPHHLAIPSVALAAVIPTEADRLSGGISPLLLGGAASRVGGRGEERSLGSADAPLGMTRYGGVVAGNAVLRRRGGARGSARREPRPPTSTPGTPRSSSSPSHASRITHHASPPASRRVLTIRSAGARSRDPAPLSSRA